MLGSWGPEAFARHKQNSKGLIEFSGDKRASDCFRRQFSMAIQRSQHSGCNYILGF